MKDNNIYLWIPISNHYLKDAIEVTRSELEILKGLLKKGHETIIINLNNRLN